MGTLVRLGTEIENALKYYYMEKKDYRDLIDLKRDINFEKNIFQRIMPWTQNNVLDLYKVQLNIDLHNNSKLKNIQELMLCRHLYAHNSGLLNDDFISKYQRLTDVDVTKLPNIAAIYPANDTYYFSPLNKLDNFIEDCRNFIRQLP